MSTDDPKLIVGVYLRGEQLDPDKVTLFLGVPPSRSQITGGASIGSARVIAKIGVWALVAQTNSFRIKDHLDELFRKIGTPAQPLSQIEGVKEAYLDIFVGLDEPNQQDSGVEFVLDRKDVEILSRLGLSVHCTMT